jgi:hypothetical protein
MTTTGYKRFAISLTALLLLSVFGGAWSFWELTLLKVREAFAAEQTLVFDEMCTKAVQSEPAEAAECLEYAVNYYPSGTKQKVESRLDQIVERQRASAVRAIIAHLRTKTSQGLGNDPQTWVKRFARK